MATHYVRRSGNSKLGPMSATYRTNDSCPADCPFNGNGCYAAGRIFALAAKLGTDDIRAVADRAIAETPIGGTLRFEVSGDVIRPNGRPDRAWIRETNRIVRARPDVNVIRYTHAWRKLTPAMFAYPVNASCETPDDVREARAAGWQTVIVGSPDLHGTEFGGATVVRCPNQTHGVTCIDCKLCSKTRTTTVLFAPHGSGRKRVLAVVSA